MLGIYITHLATLLTIPGNFKRLQLTYVLRQPTMVVGTISWITWHDPPPLPPPPFPSSNTGFLSPVVLINSSDIFQVTNRILF